MPDVGETLREARMRQRIDITDMEVETKIRAKYLRALENEEWALLPGPTFVKSFLRTYGDALGLDGRRLVEEYKIRHERVSDSELQPIRAARRDGRGGAVSGGARGGRGGGGRVGIPGWAVVAVVLAAIVAALAALGQGETDDDADRVATMEEPPARTERERGGSTGSSGASGGTERRRPRRTVRLSVSATADVWMCVEGAGGRRFVPGQVVPAGTTRTFRSRRFRTNFGNGSVRLRINGRAFEVPEQAEGIGYAIAAPRARPRLLPAGERPTCGQ
jgi:cytoskeleton protein RodZ